MLIPSRKICVATVVAALIAGGGNPDEANAASGQYVPDATTPAACNAHLNGHPVIKSYRASDRIREKLARVAKEGKRVGCVFMKELGGSCGVAGCDMRLLLGMRISTVGVNPRSYSVLARASYNSVTGKVSPVRLIKIAPFNAIVIRDPAETACPRKPGWETTVGVRKCRELQLRDANVQVSGYVDRLKRSFRLASVDGNWEKDWKRKQAALFAVSHAAWERYRDAICSVAYHETFPGSFASQHRLECLIRVTKTRRQELRLLYRLK